MNPLEALVRVLQALPQWLRNTLYLGFAAAVGVYGLLTGPLELYLGKTGDVLLWLSPVLGVTASANARPKLPPRTE